MPPVSKIRVTMSRAWSKPVYLKIASTTPSFSVEYGCSRPISVSRTMKNVFTTSYTVDDSDRLDAAQTPQGIEIYANRGGCRVLATILAQMADGNFTDGHHVHLSKDFATDGGEAVLTLYVSD